MIRTLYILTYLLCTGTAFSNASQCPNITLDGNTEATSLTSLDDGVQVNISCVSGTVRPDNETDVTLTCDNGVWSEQPVNCIIVMCPEPDKNNAVSNVTGSEFSYGTSIHYTCRAGYTLPGNVYSTLGTCGPVETFIFINDVKPKCSKLTGYMGCYDAASVIELTSSEPSDIRSCIATCRSGLYRFAAIHYDTCTCGNELNSSLSRLYTSQCDRACPGYDPTDAASTIAPFCGGDDGQQIVFAALHGCVESSYYDMNSSISVDIGSMPLTCQELCRGQDCTHALVDCHQCMCLNYTGIANALIDTSSCIQSGENGYLYDIEMTSASSTSCEALYQQGIMYHSRYYINESVPVFCNFRDNTACEIGWIGYAGNCYMFEKNETNFTSAVETCRSYNADLASIFTEQEIAFMKDAIEKLNDDPKEPITDWYVGLVDEHQSDFYTWTDGSKPTFSPFHELEPNSAGLYCATAHNAHGYLLHDFSCDDLAAYICKRSTAAGSDCLDIDQLNWVAGFTTDEETMSMTFCVEICRGKGLQYALVNSTKCRCTSALPTHTVREKLSCTRSCVGNPVQTCGGQVVGVDRVTFRNVDEFSLSRSCEELQLLGFGGYDFKLNENETEVVRFCDFPQCPFAWIPYGDHCYKFPVLPQYSSTSREICAVMGSYLLVADTADEIVDLVNIAADISLYKSFANWWTGASALSRVPGNYRWSSGRVFQSPVVNQTLVPVGKLRPLELAKANTTELVEASTDKMRLICEKGPDYVGCYDGSSIVSDVNITGYEVMTIQQCVELCRGQSKLFAFTGPSSCVCSDVEPSGKSAYNCTSYCTGDLNQACGGSGGMVSVYNVSAYDAFARSCEDLFQASIYVAGDYIINGTATRCDLLDGTICSQGWVGYEGECYNVLFETASGRDICTDYGAQLTSITRPSELYFIVSLIKGRMFWSDSGYLVTGLVDTSRLGTITAVDGLLTDTDLYLSGQIPTMPPMGMLGYNNYLQLGSSSSAVGSICKENKRMLGCFTTPGSAISALDKFGSMEWTLCYQLCIVRDKAVAMISASSCHCTDEADLVGLTNATLGCTRECPGHQWQNCGDGTVYIAHSIPGPAIVAKDCTSLYLHGIFLQTNYILRTGIIESPTLRTETCGFADDTFCPAYWLGKNGTCFLFKLGDASSMDAARDACFEHDGYLLAPSSATINSFVEDVVNGVPFFQGSTSLLTGINSVMYNLTYVSPHGDMLDGTYVDGAAVPDDKIMYNVTTDAWVPNAVSGQTSVFVCQRKSGDSGCYKITDDPDITTDVTDNSVTFCSQFCSGQEALYFGTSGTRCACFKQLPVSKVSKLGSCSIPCPGHTNQPCGGRDMLYSGFYTAEVVSVASSCPGLFQYGIWHPGWYILKADSKHQQLKAYCFDHVPPFGNISYDTMSLHASSNTAGYDVDKAKLMYPLNEAWMPDPVSLDPYVKVVFTEYHVVTGLGIKGLHTSSVEAWVTSARVKYRDGVSSALIEYLVDDGTTRVIGNDNGVDVKRRLFQRPIVSKEFFVFVDAADIALSLQVYGQRFQDFDHMKTEVGCYPSFSEGFVKVPLVSNCSVTCASSNYSLSGEDTVNSCYCTNQIDEYGYVDPALCIAANSTDYVTLHRTFTLHCDEPNQTPNNGHVLHLHTPFTSVVHSIYASVEYTCDTGYEFSDGSISANITCQMDHSWTTLGKVCQKVICPVFPQIANATVDVGSIEYLGEVNIMCDYGNWLPSSEVSTVVVCTANKTWTSVPTCSPDNLTKTQKRFLLIGSMTRTDPTFSDVYPRARSAMDCASRCTAVYYCQGANFRMKTEPVGETNCRLFTDRHNITMLESDSDWLYYTTEG